MLPTVTYRALDDAFRHLLGAYAHKPFVGVYGVPRGGVPVAMRLSALLGVPLLDAPVVGCLVVDDLVDSGATLAPYVAAGYECCALYTKRPEFNVTATRWTDGWIVFPWEVGAEDTSIPEREALRVQQFVVGTPQLADSVCAANHLYETISTYAKESAAHGQALFTE
jgi:hypothetical protein